jgi:integrase
MARPKSTGLNTVPRRDASGKIIRIDYYHRATGTKLGSDHDEAIRLAAELDGEAPPPARDPITIISGVCDDYLESSRFKRLSPKTQALNRLYVEKLRKRWGNLPTIGMTTPVVTKYKEELEKAISKSATLDKPGRKPRYLKGEEGPMTPGKAAHLMNKLTLIMGHARRIGAIKGDNPASKPGGFGVEYRWTRWGDGEIKRFMDAASPDIRAACAILFYTAQRPSDVVAMDWSRVEERPDGRLWIWLVQQKTGELIDVPAHRELAKILREVKTKDGLILKSPMGRPWIYRNFARAWDKVVRRADYRLARKMFSEGRTKDEIRGHLIGDQDLQRRDLRRTAMTRMAEVGATIAQIAAVSGHSIEQTQRILSRYIPPNGAAAAKAIGLWEADERVIKLMAPEPGDGRKRAARPMRAGQTLGNRKVTHSLKSSGGKTPVAELRRSATADLDRNKENGQPIDV